jgi:hypothetical protein
VNGRRAKELRRVAAGNSVGRGAKARRRLLRGLKKALKCGGRLVWIE